LGCIGTLKEWLLRAFELALDESLPRLTLEHLRATAKSLAGCETIAEEISNGEKRLAEEPGKRTKLLSLLGMTPAANHYSNQSARVGRANANDEVTKPSSKKRRPIEQKPKRNATRRHTRAA
jgi:hypothetical protein